MKNVLTHKNGSTILLANVDDGTNRLFINDEEIPSTSWVGSGTYTKVIDGITISITKISDLSENIQLKKVTETSFKFVRKIAAVQFSHIGQIIESTTLDTLAKVQEIYGSDTTWIQHTGYVLRGATSGVVANSAAKTGGNDNAILLYHRHSVSRQNLAESAGGHTHYSKDNLMLLYGKITNQRLLLQPAFNADHDVSYGEMATHMYPAGAHTHYISAHNTNYEGEDGTNKNIPNFKSVYIWERVS